MCPNTRTEKWPRWSSLINRIFQERLISPPFLGQKASITRPNVTLSEDQTGLTCGCRAVTFIWNSTPPTRIPSPLILAVSSDLDIGLGCSTFPKSTKEACIHSPGAAFNPLIMRGTTKPPHSFLHSHKHVWDKNTFFFIWGIPCHWHSIVKVHKARGMEKNQGWKDEKGRGIGHWS